MHAVVGSLNPNSDHSGNHRRLFGFARIAGLVSERIVPPGAAPLYRRGGTRIEP